MPRRYDEPPSLDLPCLPQPASHRVEVLILRTASVVGLPLRVDKPVKTEATLAQAPLAMEVLQVRLAPRAAW